MRSEGYSGLFVCHSFSLSDTTLKASVVDRTLEF